MTKIFLGWIGDVREFFSRSFVEYGESKRQMLLQLSKANEAGESDEVISIIENL